MLMLMFLLIYPLYPLFSSGKQIAEEKVVVGEHCDATSTVTIQRTTLVNRQREMSLQLSDFTQSKEKPSVTPQIQSSTAGPTKMSRTITGEEMRILTFLLREN